MLGNTIQLAWIYKEDFTLNKTCAVLLRVRHAQFEEFPHDDNLLNRGVTIEVTKHSIGRNELRMRVA
jgi:hypothetical protein